MLWFWLQGVVLLGSLAMAWRHGVGEGWLLFSVLEGLAIVLAILSTYAGRWRERGWAAYIPSALLIWSGLLGVLT